MLLGSDLRVELLGLVVSGSIRFVCGFAKGPSWPGRVVLSNWAPCPAHVPAQMCFASLGGSGLG